MHNKHGVLQSRVYKWDNPHVQVTTLGIWSVGQRSVLKDVFYKIKFVLMYTKSAQMISMQLDELWWTELTYEISTLIISIFPIPSKSHILGFLPATILTPNV